MSLFTSQSLTEIKYLIEEQKVDINSRNEEGKEAISFHTNENIVKYLLSKGANIKEANPKILLKLLVNYDDEFIKIINDKILSINELHFRLTQGKYEIFNDEVKLRKYLEIYGSRLLDMTDQEGNNICYYMDSLNVFNIALEYVDDKKKFILRENRNGRNIGFFNTSYEIYLKCRIVAGDDFLFCGIYAEDPLILHNKNDEIKKDWYTTTGYYYCENDDSFYHCETKCSKCGYKIKMHEYFLGFTFIEDEKHKIIECPKNYWN